MNDEQVPDFRPLFYGLIVPKHPSFEISFQIQPVHSWWHTPPRWRWWQNQKNSFLSFIWFTGTRPKNYSLSSLCCWDASFRRDDTSGVLLTVFSCSIPTEMDCHCILWESFLMLKVKCSQVFDDISLFVTWEQGWQNLFSDKIQKKIKLTLLDFSVVRTPAWLISRPYKKVHIFVPEKTPELLLSKMLSPEAPAQTALAWFISRGYSWG